MASDTISFREFARRLEVGEKTIRDGIRTGKISKGVTYESGKPKIIYEIAKLEAAEAGLGNKILATKAISTPPPKDKEHHQDNSFIDASGMTDYQSALRKKINYEAKIKELEFKEKEGTLVNKKEVYSQLFDFGKEIRTELESMQSKLSPKLIGLSDITKINEIIAIEVRNSLNKLFNDLGGKKIC